MNAKHVLNILRDRVGSLRAGCQPSKHAAECLVPQDQGAGARFINLCEPCELPRTKLLSPTKLPIKLLISCYQPDNSEISRHFMNRSATVTN